MGKREGFFSELFHRYSASNKKKYYYYFLWRNKLNNSKTDYSLLSEEDFVLKCLDGKEQSFKYLKMWESSDEYQGLMQELYTFKMNQDFYKLYETYLDKAMEGDEKAVNALKTIKKEIESLNKNTKVKKNNVEDDEKFDLD